MTQPLPPSSFAGGLGVSLGRVSSTKIDVLEKLLHEVMTHHVDWAKLNSFSPDFEREYRPVYPPIVGEATNVIEALKRGEL